MLVLFAECWGSNLSIQAGVGKLNGDLHQPSGIRYESRSFSVRYLVSLTYRKGLISGFKLSVVVTQAIGISLRNKDQNSSKSHKNRCSFLSLKWVSKSNLKFEFSENGKNATFLDLGLMKFDRGPKWLAIPKRSTCRGYLSNGYLNTVSNFNF